MGGPQSTVLGVVKLQRKFLGDMIRFGGIGEMAFRGYDVLTYTDDTTLAIGLAESISQVGRLVQRHPCDTNRANFNLPS